MDRLREHIRNINQNTDIHIVGRHFNEPHHAGTKYLQVQVLNFVKGHPDSKTSLSMRVGINVDQKVKLFVPTGLNLMRTSERNYETY